METPKKKSGSSGEFQTATVLSRRVRQQDTVVRTRLGMDQFSSSTGTETVFHGMKGYQTPHLTQKN